MNTVWARNGWNCSKQIAPGVTRVAVLRDPTIPQGIGQFGAIQSVAPSLGLEVSPVNIRDAGEIEHDVAAFARPNSGLIVTGSGLAISHRELIVTLAGRYKLPTIYFGRFFVTAGGLISYGADPIDPHRRAAGYVDRILKGEKPADLPVQAPTKFELRLTSRPPRLSALPFRHRYSPPPTRSSNEWLNVRYWHKADIPGCTAHVRFWG